MPQTTTQELPLKAVQYTIESLRLNALLPGEDSTEQDIQDWYDWNRVDDIDDAKREASAEAPYINRALGSLSIANDRYVKFERAVTQGRGLMPFFSVFHVILGDRRLEKARRDVARAEFAAAVASDVIYD